MSIDTTKLTELSKTYDPSAVEPQAYQVWLDEKCFHPTPDPSKKPYSIVIPPPNVTGALHLGHAINNTLQDILTRVHRMRGFNTVWIPGIDHAGIATQAVVEKQLKEKENKTRHELGREGLVERIWQWKQQYGDRILEQLKRMGCSCDWDRTRFTLDDMCARAVRETFFKLFKDGLIYRGKRLVNWDIFLQTSVSDDEIYHEIVKTSLWHIRYPIAGGEARRHEGTEARSGNQDAAPTYMVVATTRPETMLGDTAVAVHSEDPRWNWAIGKFVELPLTGRRIPIIADDILVDPTFGSGVVKVTPAHDPNDYAVWQRHKGQADEIDILNILTPEGKINENGGKYAGLQRDKARKQIVSDLEHAGLLEKEQPHEAPVGHSDRSKTPIEPYLSDQWFVKMAPLAEPALEVVRNGTIKFFPERHAQQYLAWLGEKRDWPISRQLWWGHRIPVWRETYGNSMFNVADYPDRAVEKVIQNADGEDDTRFICVRSEDDHELTAALEAVGFVQDPDVLDTWFSSALWPHSTLGWPEQTAELKQWYPTSVLLTGRDIITLWVARMVMTGLYNMGQIPFAHVAINPTILDGKGDRMAKTKGNGVDPVDIITTHGADAMRYTLTRMATETQDARMPVQLVCPHCEVLFPNPDTKAFVVACPKCKKSLTRPVATAVGTPEAPMARATSERFDVGRNFCNKIWNATRFALQNLEAIPAEPVDESKWSLADRWLLSRLMRTIEQADEALASYRFDQYATLCWDFFWGDLCDWYIEAIKLEMKEDSPRRGQVANILAAALDASLRLMHPMIPFITETLWWRLNEVRANRSLPGQLDLPASKRLIVAAWPAFNAALASDETEALFGKLKELIVGIRNVRNEYKVDPKKPVTVSILAPGDAAGQITANQATIELLATCAIRNVAADLQPPANAARAMAAGCEVYVEGLIDPEAEKQRNAKRRDELAKQIAAMKGRLSNESYIAKAPPHLVEQTRKQLADMEAELAKL